MPKRLVLQTVILHRDGERVVPETGKPFDFSKEELDQINGLNPDALGHIISKEDEKLPANTISISDHEALLQKAREEAVEAFKLQQAETIKESSDALTQAAAGTDKTDKSKTDKSSKSDKAAAAPAKDDDI
jgi:hypothetical protein